MQRRREFLAIELSHFLAAAASIAVVCSKQQLVLAWGVNLRLKALSLAAALFGIGGVQTASAADMPMKAPLLAPASAYNWTGLYVGLNGGYGAGTTTGGIHDAFFLGNFNINGGLFGGQIGYNYQISNLVLGVEADWDWADINGTQSLFGSSVSQKVKNLGTVRGRIGYAADRFLVYASGGFAWGASDIALTGLTTESNTLDGYALGGGLEYGVTPDLSLKAEYLYAHLDPKNYFVAQGCPGPCDAGANVSIYRVGANWRFLGQGGSAAAMPTAAAGPYNWTGLYLGANAGYGAGTTSGDIMPVYFAGNFGISGGLFGGQVGYNYQLSNIVLGVEADYDHADIGGDQVSLFGFTNGNIDRLGSVRGRAGYAWDRYLVYATGGWAWGHMQSALGPGGFADAHSHTGYVLGGGVEYGLTQNLSLKAEYLYTHLTPVAYYTAAGCPVNCDLGANASTFRVGANWRFWSMGK